MAETRKKDPRARVAQRAMTQKLAEEVVKGAQAKAKSLGIDMSVAVVDESGNLAYFARGDNCGFHTAETARGKAVMAASFRRPTHEMLPSLQANPAFWASIAGPLRLVPGGGGYPLTKDGFVIGGVGCGGGIGSEDEECAEAGANAINS